MSNMVQARRVEASRPNAGRHGPSKHIKNLVERAMPAYIVARVVGPVVAPVIVTDSLRLAHHLRESRGGLIAHTKPPKRLAFGF